MYTSPMSTTMPSWRKAIGTQVPSWVPIVPAIGPVLDIEHKSSGERLTPFHPYDLIGSYGSKGGNPAT